MKPKPNKAINPAQIAEHIDHRDDPAHQKRQEEWNHHSGPFCWQFWDIAHNFWRLYGHNILVHTSYNVTILRFDF